MTEDRLTIRREGGGDPELLYGSDVVDPAAQVTLSAGDLARFVLDYVEAGVTAGHEAGRASLAGAIEPSVLAGYLRGLSVKHDVAIKTVTRDEQGRISGLVEAEPRSRRA